METLVKKHQENQATSFIPSPKSYSSNSSTGSATSATKQSPIPITRSEPNNPYPTTFVQADTSSFKHVVQMLTGSSEPSSTTTTTTTTTATTTTTSKHENVRNNIPAVRTIPKIQKTSSKLYERRNSMKNFRINPTRPGFIPGSGSPRPGTPEILSPSILDFPSLVLSPVTPLIPDPFNRVGQFLNMKSNLVNVEAEEKAIAEKGFFLHPSPASTPTDSKPKLLPLFPETSPRVAGSSTSGS